MRHSLSTKKTTPLFLLFALGIASWSCGGGSGGAPLTPDAGAACGNGRLDDGETCDPTIRSGEPGACPSECSDGDSCTRDFFTGSTTGCNLVCEHEVIQGCGAPSGDAGTAADGSTSENDARVDVDVDGGTQTSPDGATTPDAGTEVDDSGVQPSTCGNGVLDPNETCDPAIATGEAGACPMACDDHDPCTTDMLVGDRDQCNAACTHEAATTCQDNDACCPSGCSTSDDNDCAPERGCGNGVVEADLGETCDGTCPGSVAECDDNNACTTETFTGSAATCDALCEHAPVTACIDGDGCCAPGCNNNNDDDCAPVCGNGALEQGETCDGACPTSCNDGDACTADTLSGAPSTCDVECTSTPISACANDDGCCPSACTFADDNDCAPPVCGNGQVEAGETCDGNCPTTCNDEDPCTMDVLTGSAGTCNAECTHTPVSVCASGDGCCGLGCSPIMDDECGVGRAVGEACTVGDECVTRACQSEAQSGWTGGYCTAECRLDEECDATSYCALPANASSLGACLRRCEADEDCRDGYACVSTNNSANSPKGCVFSAP
ncbi:MAG: hypothetical protein H6729_15610 [Deltaproteobacteria bacterium]|nr:hypothetical protein [Deltaproteobacteria bacterium]